MSVTIAEFGPEHLPAVRRLWERMYERPRGDAFYRWALLEPPLHEALLAVDGDECAAILRCFVREYLVGGRRERWSETFDWLAAPEHRRSAVGLRVMRAAMERWSPLVNVGGSSDTLGLLPALRWRRVVAASAWVLPLSSAALSAPPGPATPGRRAKGAALGVASATWFRPRRPRPPRGGEALAVAAVGEEVLDLYEGPTGYGMLPIPDLGHLRWLSAYPGNGHLVPLYFTLGGRLRGWALGRVHLAGRNWEASLLDVYAPRPDIALYRWMCAELVARLAAHRPVAVRAQATCPILAAALGRLRFVRDGFPPVFVWPAGAAPPPVPLHLTLSAQDGPMLPYSPRWCFGDRSSAAAAHDGHGPVLRAAP
jgi:hypothetical protein